MLPHTAPTGAQAALQRLCSGRDPVGWSIGVSEWLAGENLDVALARADQHLYEEKHR